MEKKLTWQEIEKQYDREWVQLVDYDWPEGMPYPHAGTVRVHASDRKAFYSLANKEPRPLDSAILFVGKAELPAHTTLCSSLMRIEHAGS